MIIMKFLEFDLDGSWQGYVVWLCICLIQSPMVFFREIKHLKVPSRLY
jgi:hypothetical protein